MPGEVSYDLQGRVFQSKVEMCKANNIDYGLFCNYLQRHSYEEALHYYLDTKEDKYYDLSGRKFNSPHAMCKANSINYGAFIHYIKRGNTYDEALEHYLNTKNVDLQGRVFKTQKAMCEANGINPNSFSEWLMDHKNWTVKQTLHKFLDPKEIYIDLQGRHFESIPEMCKANGIRCGTFTERIRIHKCSYKEALHFYLDRPEEIKIECIDLQGRHFETLAQLCRANNVDYETFRVYARKVGCEYKEALLNPFPNTQYTRNIFIKKKVDDSLYLCLVNGVEQILPYSFLKKQKLAEAKEVKNEQ